jgi:hypothetical protein
MQQVVTNSSNVNKRTAIKHDIVEYGFKPSQFNNNLNKMMSINLSKNLSNGNSYKPKEYEIMTNQKLLIIDHENNLIENNNNSNHNQQKRRNSKSNIEIASMQNSHDNANIINNNNNSLIHEYVSNPHVRFVIEFSAGALGGAVSRTV